MKKGFFEDVVLNKGEKMNINLFEFLEFTPIGDKCLDLYKFIHELDDEFALRVSQKFGYPVMIITEFNEEMGCEVLIHALNTVTYNGRVLFLDVRGITSNIMDMRIDIINAHTVSVWTYDNIEEAKNKLSKLTGDKYKSFHQDIDYILEHGSENYKI